METSVKTKPSCWYRDATQACFKQNSFNINIKFTNSSVVVGRNTENNRKLMFTHFTEHKHIEWKYLHPHKPIRPMHSSLD